jgi:hypothetical protein
LTKKEWIDEACASLSSFPMFVDLPFSYLSPRVYFGSLEMGRKMKVQYRR